MTTLKPAGETFLRTLIPAHPTLLNIKQVLTTLALLNSMKVTFIVATTVTVFGLLFHSMAGYALAQIRFPGRETIFYIMIGTLMIPFAVIIVPLFIVTRILGMTNSYLGLIVPSIFNAYGIFLFRQFYLGFPKELKEAAIVDGCSYAGVFFRIALPLSTPIVIPLAITFFTFNWNNYIWPLVVNKKPELNVIQVYLANLLGSGYSIPWPFVITSVAVAAFPICILFFVLQRYIVEGIKMTGIK
jgi:multiple sugar transport system permease protein